MSLLSFSQEQQTIIWELMTSKLFLQSIYLIAKYSRKIYIKYVFYGKELWQNSFTRSYTTGTFFT